MMALAGILQVDAVVDHAVRLHPRADAQPLERFNRALFEHASPNTAEYVLTVAILDDDEIDAGLVQRPAEQEPCGAGADDGDAGRDMGHGVSLATVTGGS